MLIARYIPSFQILDPSDLLLSIGDHFAEKVGETSTAELRGSSSI